MAFLITYILIFFSDQQAKPKGNKRSSGDVFNRLGDDANNDVIIISDHEPEGPPTLAHSQKRKKAKKSSDVFSRLAAPQLNTSDEDGVVDLLVKL